MSNGKGSSPRNLGPKFRENYDRIFCTVTSDDWKREVKRARATPNAIQLRIKKERLDYESEQAMYRSATHRQMFECDGDSPMRKMHGLAEEQCDE